MNIINISAYPQIYVRKLPDDYFTIRVVMPKPHHWTAVHRFSRTKLSNPDEWSNSWVGRYMRSCHLDLDAVVKQLLECDYSILRPGEEAVFYVPISLDEVDIQFIV